MSQAYTPGLLVTPRTSWQCRRVLPIAGQVLVTPGQKVEAEDIVAETQLPGDALPINLAKQMGIAASQVPAALVVPVGGAVQAGQLLAKTAGLFGMFGSEFKSPASGTMEAASSITGQVILRGAPLKVQVKAYLAGKVAEVLPGEGVVMAAPAAVVQGIFGIGGEAYGTLQSVCSASDQDLTPDLLAEKHRGAIVIGGRRITKAAFDKARSLGVSAVVSGGIDDQDLREILGYDLGVAVTGSEKLGITVIITEGFGDIAMARRTFELLQRLQGGSAAVNGTTQIRAGVLRPEIIVPVAAEESHDNAAPVAAGVLEVGVPVRVIREPNFGELGIVSGLPSEPQVLESESKARVVTVKLTRGDTVSVPRANVELIEGATA